MPQATTPAPAPVDPNQPHPQIVFDKTSNDFGVINDDNPVNTEFKFSNKNCYDPDRLERAGPVWLHSPQA